MESFTFEPKRVCSKRIDFALDEEGRLHDVKFMGGCPGNLPAIGKLVEGIDKTGINHHGNLAFVPAQSNQIRESITRNHRVEFFSLVSGRHDEIYINAGLPGDIFTHF